MARYFQDPLVEVVHLWEEQWSAGGKRKLAGVCVGVPVENENWLVCVLKYVLECPRKMMHFEGYQCSISIIVDVSLPFYTCTTCHPVPHPP